jgi:phosphoribosylformylglycinamidine cyclo-ligase
MAVVVEASEVGPVGDALEAAFEQVEEIGWIEEGPRGCTVFGKAGSWNSDEDWTATHHA